MSEVQKPLLESPSPEEEWRAIPEYEGYEISSLGRIKHTQYLRAHPDSEGYATVALWKGPRGARKEKKRKLHIMMGEVGFLGPRPSADSEINHKHFNKMDARATELEWNSRQQNMDHSFREGTRLQTAARGERIGISKLKPHQVRCIRLFRGSGWRQRSVARHFGVTQHAITLVQANKVWRHLTLSMDVPARTGENHHMAKLNAEQVGNIRALLAGGAKHADIADVFKVSRPTITMIANGTTWRGSI